MSGWQVTSDTIGWRVGAKIYNSKWTAIFNYINTPTDFGFYYYDNTWDQFDWTIEPELPIADLERQHCEYLRENNDLLILGYSGGLDSTTVLTRFIESKQHLDYIICFGMNADPNDPGNIEITIARQYLEKIRPLLPNTKFLFVNENIDTVTRFSMGNSIQSFDGKNLHKLNYELRFHHTGWTERLKLEHPIVYDELKSKSGKIIIGSHRPDIELQSDGQYWFVPNDKQDENLQDPDNHEFFWSGQNPTLFIKQCHMAKKWLKSTGRTSSKLISRSKDPVLYQTYSLNLGRMLPIDVLFSIKNCYGGTTQMEFLNQSYGIKQISMIKLCEVDRFQENMKNLDKLIDDFSEKYPHLANYDNKVVDIYGWLGKPRSVGN